MMRLYNEYRLTDNRVTDGDRATPGSRSHSDRGFHQAVHQQQQYYQPMNGRLGNNYPVPGMGNPARIPNCYPDVHKLRDDLRKLNMGNQNFRNNVHMMSTEEQKYRNKKKFPNRANQKPLHQSQQPPTKKSSNGSDCNNSTVSYNVYYLHLYLYAFYFNFFFLFFFFTVLQEFKYDFGVFMLQI